ncbi:MAG: MarR family transcriptional regulator, partial [Synergistaceae bacterium]
VRNLEQMGLIYRRENPGDKRSFLIGITVKGRDLMDIVFRGHMNSLSEAFSKLTEEEKGTVVGLLKKLRP